MNLNIFPDLEVKSSGLSMKNNKKYVHKNPNPTEICGNVSDIFRGLWIQLSEVGEGYGYTLE